MSALEKQTLTETSRLQNIVATLEVFLQKLENKKNITSEAGNGSDVINGVSNIRDVANFGANENGNEIK